MTCAGCSGGVDVLMVRLRCACGHVNDELTCGECRGLLDRGLITCGWCWPPEAGGHPECPVRYDVAEPAA